ncbi:MAG: glycine betaine catabolism [Chloroflexota bacterium]|jgi:Rieske 2Fe-2S family protein|nr:glycine betaine catabolism [Chloroflexota bacterium]
MSLQTSGSPFSADEVRAVRQPVDRASMLPKRAFHDRDVLDFELATWFGRDWVFAGREEDAAAPGEYFLANVAGESVVVIRGDDRQLRAFHNVCRHRGSRIQTDERGRVVRFQCPYHAWTYDLAGRLQRAAHTDALVDFEPSHHGLVPVRLTTWLGFVFLSLDPAAPPLEDDLAGLARVVAQFPVAGLRRGRRIEYDVRANWKVIAENYSECYHCPGVHPQLNRLTPYDQGQNVESDGPWAGGWMELVPDADTMSTDGQSHGRPPLDGLAEEDLRRIYYFVVWPNLLLSLHPDYVMTHQVWPLEPGRSRVVCEWLFDPQVMARPDFDPSDAIDFWDLTNRQDWRVCELQQEGTSSAAYTPGRYSLMEDMVHAFDLMCADRYAGDGVVTRFAPRHDKWRDPAAGRRRATTGSVAAAGIAARPRP